MMIGVLLLACVPSAQEVDPGVTVELGAEGGRIYTGGLTLTVPAGALEGPTAITVREEPTPDGFDALGPLYRLQPEDLVLDQAATVELSVAVTDATVFQGQGGGVFEPLDSVVTGGRVIAEIDVLSPVFAVQTGIQPVDTDPPQADTDVPPGDTGTPSPVDTGLPSSHPVPGGSFQCGTGLDDVVDLAFMTDTTMAVPATHPSCGPGTAALVDGAAYPTLAAALASAAVGSTVAVCPGVHTGPFGWVPDGLVVHGLVPDPAATVLTAELAGRLFWADGDLTVRDLTLRRGYGAYDGGAISADGQLTVQNVRFDQNVACYGGGAVRSIGPTLIENATFVDNVSGYDGGAATLGTRWDPSDIVVRDSTFLDNTSGYEGGALVVDGNGGFIRVQGSTFVGNRADYEGGAIANGSWDSHLLEIDACYFEDNESRNGAALTLATWSPADEVVVRDSQFVAHETLSSVVDISHWEGGDFTFTNVDFVDNTAGQCVLAASVGTVAVQDVTFTGSTNNICITGDATLVEL